MEHTQLTVGDMTNMLICFGALLLLSVALLIRPTQRHPDVQVMAVRRVGRGLNMIIVPATLCILCSIGAGLAGGAQKAMGEFDAATAGADTRFMIIGVVIVLIIFLGAIVDGIYYHEKD